MVHFFRATLAALLAAATIAAGQDVKDMKTGGRFGEECPAPFPFSICEPGRWPCADVEMGGEWWPSRSTHYGSTSGGACGMDDFPNCATGSSCGGAPSVVLDNVYAGKYCAPQGDYFAQTGQYLSCGECFEVRCVDPKWCHSTEPVFLRVADACPCYCNTKWCCGNWSTCALEVAPDSDGHPHCSRISNSLWGPRSLHLDLNDVAMTELVWGKGKSGDMPGVVNTYARRVPCSVKGNVHLKLSSSVSLNKDCVAKYPDKADCFYYLAFAVINVAGTGSVSAVEAYTKVVSNNVLTEDWIKFQHDPNSPSSKPQEQYGKFVAPQNVAIFFPMKFRITNRIGQVVESKTFTSSADWPTGGWVDIGVQFEMPKSVSNTAIAVGQDVTDMKTGGLYGEECPAPFPFSICEPGKWPCADVEMGGEWWPSRSTHYGSTSGGACGMDDFPNCLSNSSCDGAPSVLFDNVYAGKYCAPQGDYFAQTGQYLSCGECFEVRCVDPKWCHSTEPVFLRVADACPCYCNTKWCCGNWSTCALEMLPDTDGYPHCARSNNSLWGQRSLHLDLNDVAMMELAWGKGNSGDLPGVVNTYARRVPCSVKGNVHLKLSSSVSINKNCVVKYPDTADCFYYLAFAVINVEGTGSVSAVEAYTKVVSNSTTAEKWVTFQHDPNSPSSKPQEQYGKFVAPQNVAIFFPIKFRITNRLGQVVTSKTFTSSSDWPSGLWVDLGVQFATPQTVSSDSSGQCNPEQQI
eukprot:m51a1_g5479 hypothetical protein (744) ;mRNA; r:297564-300698